jgi:hypothetical protein
MASKKLVTAFAFAEIVLVTRTSLHLRPYRLTRHPLKVVNWNLPHCVALSCRQRNCSGRQPITERNIAGFKGVL